MKQAKRFGHHQMGMFTEWNRSSNNRCLYCGDDAHTKEHIPSKVFLKEPLPDNLPTVPACFKCNNGFSADEMYVSCYLDTLKNSIYPDCILSEKTTKLLLQQPTLRKVIEEQIQSDGKTIKFTYDYNRLINIIKKLAMGHAAYEFDYVNIGCHPDIKFNFYFNMTPEQINTFWNFTPIKVFPELGCRAYQRIMSAVNIHSLAEILFFSPVIVQQNEYVYHVFFDENGNTCVQIIIGDFLYCTINLE